MNHTGSLTQRIASLGSCGLGLTHDCWRSAVVAEQGHFIIMQGDDPLVFVLLDYLDVGRTNVQRRVPSRSISYELL